MANDIYKQPEQPAPRKRVAIKSIIICILVVAVAAAVVAALLNIRSATIGEKAATVVCGSDVVTQYNDIRTNEDDSASAQDALNTLADSVTAKPGYRSDTTCQYVVFMAAYGRSDANAMENSLNQLIDLDKSGKTISQELNRVEPIDDLKSHLNDVKNGAPELKNYQDGEG
jgi:hypothetical protein